MARKPVAAKPVARTETRETRARSEGRESRIVRYFKEVRAEVNRVVWPTRRATINLTGIVLAVMFAMSIALGLVDWLFTRLFGLIVG